MGEGWGRGENFKHSWSMFDDSTPIPTFPLEWGRRKELAPCVALFAVWHFQRFDFGNQKCWGLRGQRVIAQLGALGK